MRSDVILRGAPYVAIVLVAVVDALTGPSLDFVPLLTLGPTFACAYGGVRRTVLAGAAAVAVCLVSAVLAGRLGTWQLNMILATIAAVTGVSMLVARLRLGRERVLADVRQVAETAQRVLLRPIPRKVGDLTVALSYTSASAEARIGGDLLEVFATPYGVRVLLGDVQGKGLAAVETAAWVLGAFREAVYDERDLVAVSGRLETTLARQLAEEEFVTAILAEVDATGIRLLNHGHPPPLLLGADGRVEPVEPPEEGLALGLAALACAPPKPRRVPFLPGDLILFYTDGVIESRDAAGAFYPLAERASLLLSGDPQVALDRLREDLVEHVGGPLLDDAAMLLLRRRTSAS